VLRRVRTSLLKDIGPDDLAATFDVLQRIEQSADRMSEQHSDVEEL
jgi:MarR family transcriptional regulator, transcriptional regulator for hemolysin